MIAHPPTDTHTHTHTHTLTGEGYSPKIVVVVVQKRISTRIFQRGTAKGLGNPPPGTVVDHTFTRKGW